MTNYKQFDNQNGMMTQPLMIEPVLKSKYVIVDKQFQKKKKKNRFQKKKEPKLYSDYASILCCICKYSCEECEFAQACYCCNNGCGCQYLCESYESCCDYDQCMKCNCQDCSDGNFICITVFCCLFQCIHCDQCTYTIQGDKGGKCGQKFFCSCQGDDDYEEEIENN